MPGPTTRVRNAAITRGWNRFARVYDTPLVQRLAYRPPQDEIIEQLRSSRARRIADIGCGTGILAARIGTELAPEIVYGCDPSAGMLGRAGARSERVRWITTHAEDLALPDGAVDAVVSTHAFHFFDHAGALAEFHRVLVPGGLLAIVLNSPRAALAGVLQPGALREIAYFPGQEELGAMITAAGFTLVVQRPVRRPMPAVLVPDVLTVARRD